jgi:hypothetical protein
MRVIVFHTNKLGKIKVFGRGTFIGNRIPNHPYYIKSLSYYPCVQMDSGEYVWSFQLSWFSPDRISVLYDPRRIVVDKHGKKQKYDKIEEVFAREISPLPPALATLRPKGKRRNLYKFNVVTPDGRHEPWSGFFNGIEAAEEWYETHGKWHEARGFDLVLVLTKSINDDYIDPAFKEPKKSINKNQTNL